MSEAREIYCCGCGGRVSARLTNGAEVYPHRRDLAKLPFWVCDTCANFVGCHHKTSAPTNPLGCIPTPEIKRARIEIHKILDPIWRNGKASRGDVYAKVAQEMGQKKYHTANIRSVEEARRVYLAVLKIAREATA